MPTRDRSHIRRVLLAATIPAFLAAGCSDDPPINITVAQPDDRDNGLVVNDVYVMEEGQTLDLIVTSPGAQLRAENLPENASFDAGVFTFSPDYSQSGVYSIDFIDEIAGTAVSRSIGVRVNNVVFMPSQVVAVPENGTKSVLFASDDPAGTEITFSSSLADHPIPGASVDVLTGEVTFSPSYTYLDAQPNPAEITLRAHVREADSGIERVTETVVQFDVEERTSFDQEIEPILPNCTQNGTGCHSGGAPSAGLNLSADLAYASIVNVPPGSLAFCGDSAYAAYVAPGDLSSSLLYQKIIGGQSCGERMPYNCDELENIDCLNEDQIRKINVWIANGAPNN